MSTPTSTKSPEDYSKEDKDIMAYTKAEFAKQQANNKNIMFIISRSKNRNIVVYEGKVDDQGKLKSDPVEVYWLDIEPSYQKANRDSGKMDDRADLNFMEKKMAYGLSATVDAASNTAQICLVSLPDRTLTVEVDASGNAVCYGLVNGQRCRITFIYVKSVERTFLPPKCIYVDLCGVASDGSTQIERINA